MEPRNLYFVPWYANAQPADGGSTEGGVNTEGGGNTERQMTAASTDAGGRDLARLSPALPPVYSLFTPCVLLPGTLGLARTLSLPLALALSPLP